MSGASTMTGGTGNRTPGGASGGQSAPAPDDTVTLVTNGQRLTGWTTLSIQRAVEMMPSRAAISLTERYPGQAGDIIVKPGDTCQVMIGADPVITGYIDRYVETIGPRGHQITVQVRGKCEDLVDCSAGIYPISGSDGFLSRGMVVTASSVLGLATDLAQPFGIKVTSAVKGGGALAVPTTGAPVQFNIILTETPAEIIERAARYAAVLAYDGTDGNLIIASVGASTHASGFDQGVNLQDFGITFTLDQRYSIYLPSLMSTDQFHNLATGGVFMTPVRDRAVPRFRPLIVVSEQSSYSVQIAQQRAAWEMNRRLGRSQQLRVTCDSWRDSAGTLWTPNAFAPINIPALKLTKKKWIISEVDFVRNGDRGTVADLVLMPKEAFSIEPSTLQLYDWQVGQDLQGGAANTPQHLGPGGSSDG